MRITSRTPPVRIAAADMIAMASLPAEHAGLLLRWGMRRYAEGLGVPVEEARIEAAMDQRAWTMFLQVARTFLDADALDAGTIVVEPFARAADNLAKVSASKVRAPVSREKAAAAIGFAASLAAGGSTARPRVRKPSETTSSAPTVDLSAPIVIPQTTSIGSGSGSDRWADLAAEIVSRGSTEAEVAAALPGWRERYAVEDVVDAVQSIAERRVAKPVKYLNTMLANMVAGRRAAMPTEVKTATDGGLLPRPVKRRIQVGPRAGWHFEGWTARGHVRGGDAVEDRREIWRNESGTLTYKQPDPESDRTVPTYEEDPGFYETD